jgi:outer membrane protein insertion porin family
VEKIEVRGNNKTKDKVIRRELAISPGETFDMTRVKLSKKRLEGLQYFEKVETRTEPTDVPSRKNLVVDVEEKNTGNLSFGAGFSTVDSIVGFVEVSQGNFDLFNPPTFTGGGQKARLRVQMGTERQDYILSFVEPWFLDRKLALGVDLYHREMDYQSRANLYSETRTGGRLSLTRALGSDFLIGGVSYTFENVGINDVPTNAPPSIQQAKGSSLLAKLGASLAYDTRNSTMLPDRGQRTELLADLAAAPGDHEFYKVELKTTWYLKIPKDPMNGIFELSARAGVADAFSGTVPFYERFYLGGMYSLRGFNYRDVGPQEAYIPYSSDTNSVPTTAYEPVGGNTYWFGSLEYSVPVIERVRLAVFYDIGNVYSGAFSFSTDNERPS